MNLTKIFLLFLFFSFLTLGCSDDEIMDNSPIEMNNPDEPTDSFSGTIWSNGALTFTLESGVDPLLPENQDRITSNVFITRGSEGGQIFNAVSEKSPNKDTSPAGTRWARGKAEDAATLEFDTFRATIKPKEIVGVDLVMHMVEDNIYINVVFREWTEGKQGGFSYTRSTQ